MELAILEDILYLVVQLDGNTGKEVILLPKSLHAFVFNQLHATVTAEHKEQEKRYKIGLIGAFKDVTLSIGAAPVTLVLQ